MKNEREFKLIIDEKKAIDDKFDAYGDVAMYALNKAREYISYGDGVKASFYNEIAERCIDERQGCVQDLDIIIERLKGLV